METLTSYEIVQSKTDVLPIFINWKKISDETILLYRFIDTKFPQNFPEWLNCNPNLIPLLIIKFSSKHEKINLGKCIIRIDVLSDILTGSNFGKRVHINYVSFVIFLLVFMLPSFFLSLINGVRWISAHLLPYINIWFFFILRFS